MGYCNTYGSHQCQTAAVINPFKYFFGTSTRALWAWKDTRLATIDGVFNSTRGVLTGIMYRKL